MIGNLAWVTTGCATQCRACRAREMGEASRESPEMKIINRVSERVQPIPAFSDTPAEKARELRGRIQLLQGRREIPILLLWE